MSRADGVLVVVLKRKPFEEILAGRKLEEYRGWNWAGKILHERWRDMPIIPTARLGEEPELDFHPYHTLRAYLGYRSDRPMLERKIRRIRWGTPNPAWTYGIVSGDCFVIELEGAP